MTDRGDYMRNAQWQKGFAQLSHHNLSFDLQMYDHQTPDAVALAKNFPETTIVVEHLGWPMGDLSAGFDRWRQHMTTLGECPNAFLKLSGHPPRWRARYMASVRHDQVVIRGFAKPITVFR